MPTAGCVAPRLRHRASRRAPRISSGAAHLVGPARTVGRVWRSYALCDPADGCDRTRCRPGGIGPQTGGVVAAVSFTWLGMVLAISFLEAPLKFRAPGVTVALGLGIGRLVFRALNRVELVLLVLAVVAVAVAPRPALVGTVAGLGVLLGVQLGVVRPALNRRSDRVLAGEELPRSRGHLVYIALEVVKVALLVALGTVALA